MSAFLFNHARPVGFNPGIPGFIKASRHYSGSALVMTELKISDTTWIGTFWVKRLAHNAARYAPQYFRMPTEITRKDMDPLFDYKLGLGPPPPALRDRQRIRVYDWEDENIYPQHPRPMPWHGCLFFTKYVWERVGEGKPLVLSSDGKTRNAMSLGGKIHIPDDIDMYRTKPVLLHEMAHELAAFDQHGPTFVSTYIDLCVRFLAMNRHELCESATRYGVEFLS